MTRCHMVAALVLLFAGNFSARAQQEWVFAYFREPGTQGIYLAMSHDGYHFTPLNEDQPWIKPQQPGEIMRDVFITRGPDRKFHMVWTWGWHGNSLGYAESLDLIHWSPQKQIPIMQDYPETRNVWAPEIYWDARRREWLVIWSSSMNGSDAGNRIYSSLTADFQQFSKPSVFFDPGYVVIDATMFHGAKNWYLVFKDQTPDPLRYQVRYATAPTVEGPWEHIAPPLTESWSEGAACRKRVHRLLRSLSRACSLRRRREHRLASLGIHRRSHEPARPLQARQLLRSHPRRSAASSGVALALAIGAQLQLSRFT
jgi:hypothetical protein